MPLSPLSSGALLNQLCLLSCGGPLDTHEDEFRASLYAFRKELKIQEPTTRAIRYWLKKRTTPKRAVALRFLVRYFANRIQRPFLPDDQKLLYDELAEQLKYHQRIDLPEGTTTDRRTMLSVPQSPATLHEIGEHLLGAHSLYHIRLTEDLDYPLARELIYIYKMSDELKFIIYNQSQHGQPFTGNVLVLGTTIWFFGFSGPSNRLRTMAFRNINSDNTVYYLARWGIMCSNIPFPDAPEPSACRVLLWKCPQEIIDIETAAAYANDHVKNYSKEECATEPVRTIYRLISNNTSAGSRKRSTIPLETRDTFPDLILKVDEETVQSFCELADARWRSWVDEQQIAGRARLIWERENREDGRSVEHWERAKAELATEEKIRQRAHLIWEREGQPQDRAVAHWNEAKAQIEREEAEAHTEAREQ